MNITNFLKKEYDHAQTEYEEMINSSEISNGDDAIADGCNDYNTQKAPDIKRGKYQNSFITDDDRKLIISKNSSSNLKENFLIHKQKHNVSLTLYHEINTKNLEIFY